MQALVAMVAGEEYGIVMSFGQAATISIRWGGSSASSRFRVATSSTISTSPSIGRVDHPRDPELGPVQHSSDTGWFRSPVVSGEDGNAVVHPTVALTHSMRRSDTA